MEHFGDYCNNKSFTYSMKLIRLAPQQNEHVKQRMTLQYHHNGLGKETCMTCDCVIEKLHHITHKIS